MGALVREHEPIVLTAVREDAPMQCPSCGAENAEATKFCIECGAPLQARCPQCGSAHLPRARFCGECGAPLPSSSFAAPPAALVPRSQPPLSYNPATPGREDFNVPRGPGRGAQAGHGALLRPGQLHAPGRAPGARGHAHPVEPVLRVGPG